MIEYDWCTALEESDSRELADLLERAAAYDAEPEYNTIEHAQVVAAMADPGSGDRHLLIWLQPRPRALDAPLEPRRLAGIIRFIPGSEDWFEATLVIDPEFRSIGVMTLLMERAGTAPAQGWLGSDIRRIRSWARGNHPASQRLADRNLVPRDRQIWKLIRPVSASDAQSPLVALSDTDSGAVADFLGGIDENGGAGSELRQATADVAARGDTTAVLVAQEEGRVTGVIGLDLRPVFSEEFGKSATVRYLLAEGRDEARMKGLVTGVSDVLRGDGLQALIIHVESDDDRLVRMCRLAGFQHDRTDIRYEFA